MAHWYDSSGKLVEKVNGRKTTIREARKYNLRPSVTAIIDQLDKPGLNVWKLNQLFQAVSPYIGADLGVVTAEEVRQEIFMEAAQEQRTAAQLGTYIHSQFEDYVQGKEVKEDRLCEDILVYIQKHFGKIKQAEVTFSNAWYGGCIDIVGETPEGRPFIVDLKTTKFKDTKTAKALSKKEHGMQLAAYAEGIHKGHLGVLLGNVFVDTSEGSFGELRHYTWGITDISTHWEMFCHLMYFWYLDKGFEFPEEI